MSVYNSVIEAYWSEALETLSNLDTNTEILMEKRDKHERLCTQLQDAVFPWVPKQLSHILHTHILSNIGTEMERYTMERNKLT